MRRLTLTIDEPLPGKVLPHIAESTGPDQAAAHYRAIVATTLRQLRWLKDTRILIRCEPSDADESIRFWLLPRLADQWQSRGSIYETDGWEISFGDDEPADIVSTGHPLCPFLSARWVQTAMLGLESGTHRAIGKDPNGDTYFEAQSSKQDTKSDRPLPELPIIHTLDDWNTALTSPLGPALKKALEKELH